MSTNWPAGRTEQELLERVYKRARTIRTRKRAGFAGIASAVAAAALVPALLVGVGHPSQSIETAGQSARSAGRASSGGPAALGTSGRSAKASSASRQASAGDSTGSAPAQSAATGSAGGGQILRSRMPSDTTVPGNGPQPAPTTVPGSTPTPNPESVNPSQGPMEGGTMVAVTGYDLQGVTRVYFGDVRATTFRVVSPTELQVVSPPSSQPGVVPVAVYDSHDRGGFERACSVDPACADGFTYLPPSPFGNAPAIGSAGSYAGSAAKTETSWVTQHLP